MSTHNPHEGQVKVCIRLRGSACESGFEYESLWAEPLGQGRFRIWNVPVFAYNIDLRATVECFEDPDGSLPIVARVLEPGDCPTIRLYFAEAATEDAIQAVLDLLAGRQAVVEKYSRSLWAVGLRSEADYQWAGPALEPFVEAGLLTFESAFQPDEPQIEETAEPR